MTGTTNAHAVAIAPRTSDRAAARVLALATALLFVLHGVAHAVGFAGTFGLSESNAINEGFTLVGGLDTDGLARHALGVLWLVPIPLYVVAAAGLMLRRRWWAPWALAATFFSTALCVLWLEPAKVGMALNVVILAGLGVYALVSRRERR
mgnify:CR=1 FL=1